MDLKTVIQNTRNFLIATSLVRSAAYCQAYEHILIQHLFENILKIQENPEDYAEISKRNSLIENKFEYKEIAYRVSLAMYRRQNHSRHIISIFQELFKNAASHKEFEYCKNLLTEMSLLHKELCSYLFFYYEFKYQLLTNKFSLYTKSRIREV